MYWYPKLKLLLMVYVDDFKISGPAGNLEAGWRIITEGIKLAGIGPVSNYLGCDHATFDAQSTPHRCGGYSARCNPSWSLA